MANLPNKPFMFNYNARDYISSSRTIPKTTGQLFDNNIVLNKAPSSYTSEYIDFGTTSAYTGYSYSTASDNPFNRDSSHNDFTFIYKTSGWTTGDTNIFANRKSNYNYMVRPSKFHTSSTLLYLTATTSPEICVMRINSDGTSVRRFVDSNGNVLQSTTASSITWGNASDGIGFFTGYATGGEYFNKKFYWMYCSNEALTDDEILQVIRYNEGGSIDISTNTISTGKTSGNTSLTIATQNGWSASTQDTWITLSQSSGSGNTTISVSWNKNNFDGRTVSVTFTDTTTQDTAILIITQEANNIIPIYKMYRGGDRIN